MAKNENIGCDVNECRHHSTEGNYCSLNKVQIIKHGGLANSIESTDCGNFETK